MPWSPRRACAGRRCEARPTSTRSLGTPSFSSAMATRRARRLMKRCWPPPAAPEPKTAPHPPPAASPSSISWRTTALRPRGKLDAYREAAGKPLTLGGGAAAAEPWPTATIPGPSARSRGWRRSRAEAAPEDVLPALARNVVTNGYQASHSNDALEQTEYLKLVHPLPDPGSRAREARRRPTRSSRSRPASPPPSANCCEISATACAAVAALRSCSRPSTPPRAFLTTDSGFPLADLEQALRTNRPFTYDFQPDRGPGAVRPGILAAGPRRKSGEFIDAFLGDPSLCRLYLGLLQARPRDRRGDARRPIAVQRLKVFAHVLDFFGGMFEIRDGKAIMPGGAALGAGMDRTRRRVARQGRRSSSKSSLPRTTAGWPASTMRWRASMVRSRITSPIRRA